VLVNLQLSQATTLWDIDVDTNVCVRPVSSLEEGERRNLSSTQLWLKITIEVEPGRRTRSSKLFRCRLTCPVNENQIVQIWMLHDCA